MKVGIYESVEVSDEQRKAIAATLGQKSATRDDLKAFIWKWGEQWPLMVDKPQDATVLTLAPAAPDEDLLGAAEAAAPDAELEDLL